MNTIKPETETVIDATFKKDVLKGLTSYPKYLYSKYIYDKAGDELFQDIMAMPSYYLTDAEFEIITDNKSTITQLFCEKESNFDFIELGVGDGEKTKVLLEHLINKECDLVYKPVDISQNAIDNLSTNLKKEIPYLKVNAERGEYFEVLKRIRKTNVRKKVIVFLGSNIGNLSHQKAIDFLSQLKDTMNADDLLFIGFDQKKDPQIILDAYNDKTGITANFNKNLLTRINRELNADFDLESFKHWETYNPETGTAKSYLVATKQMTANIEKLNLKIEFEQWETIHTEISQKYDDKTITWIAKEAGLTVKTSFVDSNKYYKNYVFTKT